LNKIDDLFDNDVEFKQNVVVEGNLTVNGTTVSINTDTYSAEKLDLIGNTNINSPILKITKQNEEGNIVEIYKDTDPVIIVNNFGNFITSNITVHRDLTVKGNINDVTVSELGHLKGTNDNIQTQLDNKQDVLTAGNGINIVGDVISVDTDNIQTLIDNTSKIDSLSYYTSNTLRNSIGQIGNIVSTLDTDNIKVGINNKFITNNVWKDDLTISGTLFTSNIRAVGSNTIVFTDIYTTESLGVISTAEDSDALYISHSGAGQYKVMNATVADQPVFVITKDKYVGIGTSTPSNPLHVIGNGYFTGDITQAGTTKNITTEGSIGIGRAEPAHKLDVDGDGYFNGDITATGNIIAFSPVVAGYSDNRLKTYISDIVKPLDIVDKLKGFYYEPNDLAKSFGYSEIKKEIGLSAQDVNTVLPELTSIAPFDRMVDENGNVKSKSGENYITVSYERLAPVFVEAIKEINQELIKMKQFMKEFEEFKKNTINNI
jgi:cytoskeletal protein CcmA (bactofilin family)